MGSMFPWGCPHKSNFVGMGARCPYAVGLLVKNRGGPSTTPIVVGQRVIRCPPRPRATSPSLTPTSSVSPSNGHQLPRLRRPICPRVVGLPPSILTRRHFLCNPHPGPGTGPVRLAVSLLPTSSLGFQAGKGWDTKGTRGNVRARVYVRLPLR